MINRTLAALLAAILLVLVACGSGGSEAAVDEAETLDDFFGVGHTTPATAAEFREQEVRVQEAIRQCMAEQGFEYEPMLPPEDAFEVMDEGDEEERVRTEGFGITTNWFGNEEALDEGIEWEDLNQGRLNGMSDGERQAWEEALWGSVKENEGLVATEVDPETGVENVTALGPGAGCQGKAWTEETGGQNQVLQELRPELMEMEQRIRADPRIVAANDEWARCMAERGYDYESPEALFETVFPEFHSRLDEITGGSSGGDPFAGWTEDEINAFFEEKTEEEIEAFFAEQEQAGREDIDLEAVAELRQEEIDLAVADFECSEGMDELRQEVSADHEAEFIADNREQLEEIRDAQE